MFQNIKNGKVYEGWGSQLFLPELEFDANKYNL